MFTLLFSFLLYFSLASVPYGCKKTRFRYPRPALKKQRHRAYETSEEQCTNAAQTSL